MIDGQQQYQNLAAAVLVSAKESRSTTEKALRRLSLAENRTKWLRDYLKTNTTELKKKHELQWKSERRARRSAVLCAKKSERLTIDAQLAAGEINSHQRTLALRALQEKYAPALKTIDAEKYRPLTDAGLRALARTALNGELKALEYEKAIVDDLLSGPSLWSELLGLKKFENQ